MASASESQPHSRATGTPFRRLWHQVSPTLRGPQFLLDLRAARHIEAYFNQARVVLVGCLLLLAYIGALTVEGAFGAPTLAIAGCAWVGSVALLIRYFYRPWVAIAIGLVDTVFVSALVYATGGPGSPLDALYGIIVFAAIVRFTRVHSILFTIAVLLAYVDVTWFHPLFDPAIHGRMLAARAVILAATGMLAWLVAAEVERQRRAVGETQQQLASLTTITHVSHVLAASQVPDEIAAAAVSLVQELVRPAAIGLVLADGAGGARVAAGAGAWTSASSPPRRGRRRSAEPDATAGAMRGSGCGEVLVLPLEYVAQPTGWLCVGASASTRLAPADRALLGRIAEETGAALQRAELLEREKRRASENARLAEENGRLLRQERDTVARLRQLAGHKDAFIGMVAHELRTPLTSIKGFAQLLLRSGTNDSAANRYSTVILAQSNRMMDIIDEIVDLSRMEHGLLQMRRDPVDLAAIVDEVVAQAQESGLAIELESPDVLPRVPGDADKLRQTLSHLVQSGAKYRRDATPLRLSIDAGKDAISIALQIEGDIPEQRLAHIFEEVPTDADLPRSGLGLYICKNYVEAHGGRLGLERTDEVARFVVELPVHEEAPATRFKGRRARLTA